MTLGGAVYFKEVPCVHSILNNKIPEYCDGCLKNLPNLSSCSSCKVMRYCSRSCQRRMWNMHKLECKQYIKCGRLPTAQVRLVLRIIRMQNDARDQINSLISHENEIRANPDLMEMYYTIRVVVSNFLDGDVFVNEETIFQTFCRIQINSFMVTDPNGVDVGLALYPRAARLDHSCIPELQYLFSSREIILYGYDSSIHSTAPRINYYECMTTTEERQAYLLKNYYFKCNCGLCTDSDREKRITALICCSSDYLNGPIIFDKLPSFVKLKVCNDDKFARPIMVRYCPTCLKVYDDSLINQIAGHLYGETKVHVDIDTALDALIMYSRCCPTSKPIQNIQLTTVKDIQLEESRSYYKLFGHKDSLHVARCCSRVQFLHTISIDSLFDIVNKRHQYNVKRLEISKDTLVNVIIAISLNEYYWRTTWLLSDRLQLGQLAYSVASFLLYHISDIDEFRNSNRMNEIKNHLTFVYNTYNNFDCLGHVLCKFSSIAYDILSPLTEYRFNWQQGLNTLVYYKAQDIEGSNIINDIRELV